MIGIFGGTFDPIHIGHLILCRDVIGQTEIEKIIIVPANISPFKTDQKSTSPAHRLKMVELAIKDDPLLEVSDVEIKRGGISYTIDTLMHFKKYFNNVALIIGADQAKDFKGWKEWEKILLNFRVFVLRRVGLDFELLKGMTPLNTRIIEISSTEIRKRVSQRKDIRYLVPYPVEEYIKRHNLYTTNR